jgi:hypothetical protein
MASLYPGRIADRLVRDLDIQSGSGRFIERAVLVGTIRQAMDDHAIGVAGTRIAVVMAVATVLLALGGVKLEALLRKDLDLPFLFSIPIVVTAAFVGYGFCLVVTSLLASLRRF